MTVRAKLKLSEIQQTHFPWSKQTVLKFLAEYDPTIPEDQRFQATTPTGSASFQIDNPDALAQFTPGASYYIDFTPAPKV
jgi:hypothetical protein